MNNNIKHVINNSTHIELNLEAMKEYIKEIENLNYSHWSENSGLNLTEKEWIKLVFLIESMNFCFWHEPNYKIISDGEEVKNSSAMFASVINEVKHNPLFLEDNHLKNITEIDLYKIFNTGDTEISFIKERYRNFVATVKLITSQDFFWNLFKISSDLELRDYIVLNLKHFEDKCIYKAETIYFNKRANLLVNDLFRVSNTINGNICNINKLDGCADYVLPKIFRDKGLLIYDEELANKIDNKILIEKDSEEEIEIRAYTLYVIELIQKELSKQIPLVELDNIIWNTRTTIKNKSNNHRTITMCY